MLSSLSSGGVIHLKYFLKCWHFVRPHWGDGVPEDAAEPPVSERLERAARGSVVRGTTPRLVLDCAVNCQAVQAEPLVGNYLKYFQQRDWSDLPQTRH